MTNMLDMPQRRSRLWDGDLAALFTDFGWDTVGVRFPVPLHSETFALSPVAQKRGVQVFECRMTDGALPDYATRQRIEREASRNAAEILLIFTDAQRTSQVWQWSAREPGRPVQIREVSLTAAGQSEQELWQHLNNIAFTVSDDETLNLLGVVSRQRDRFDRDKVTKKFSDRFEKQEHPHFCRLIDGISDDFDRAWYTSVMINRIMFLFFIQSKGFLNGERDYLQKRLQTSAQSSGINRFYRAFLQPLFFEGLAKHPGERPALFAAAFGQLPHLSGSVFGEHPVERRYENAINIPDSAFAQLFAFLTEWNWQLDHRALTAGNEINPDILGYIFEKHINQKQMGAYYTKEDITEYIGRNTIVPFVLSRVQERCANAFSGESSVWDLLRLDPDRYIYPAVRHGADLPLPDGVAAGVSDVKKRGGWNRPAPSEWALPMETWRETIARRQRCADVRDQLASGSVVTIDDLITLNLDIRQFAQDVIAQGGGAELLSALWETLNGLSILDPTCGSGAFLFAALEILLPLYRGCLTRMAGFVDDADRANRPREHPAFRAVLAEIGPRVNTDYCLLKRLISSNLYGVDIMSEAAEICRLRLFLLLASHAEADLSQENLGIEPLPDLESHIRAGNTLVGFAVSAHPETREQADARLSCQYGAMDEEEFDAWKNSHKPFHWSLEFDRVMNSGGFSVIVGNPPYVEYTKKDPKSKKSIADLYALKGYQTLSCGNLYAFVMERNNDLLCADGYSGMIVPHSGICTDRMQPVIALLDAPENQTWLSTYDIRPSQLFAGVDQRLAIYIMRHGAAAPSLHSSAYHRWSDPYRPMLFSVLEYADVSAVRFPNSVPKIRRPVEGKIWSKLHRAKTYPFGAPTANGRVFYHNAPRYWIRAMDFAPYFWNERDGEQVSSHVKSLPVLQTTDAAPIAAIINSSLFYWWFILLSNCRDFNMREIEHFPFGLQDMTDETKSRLAALSESLMSDWKRNAIRKECFYQATGKVVYDEFYPKHSKKIMDEIDCVLSRHYGLTDEELDFIINYDIKYRMGRDDARK